MNMTLEEALAHAGLLTPYSLEERALEALPHYLWMFGTGEKKWGVCSGCHQVAQGKKELENYQWIGEDPYVDDLEYDPFVHPGWYKTKRDVDCQALHNHKGYCPNCGRIVTYKHAGRGHSAVIDRIFLIDYRKSAIEENTLVMVGSLVIGSWDKALHEEMTACEFEPDLTIEPMEICIFRFGKGACRFVREHIWTAELTQRADGGLYAHHYVKVDLGWVKRTEVNGSFSPDGTMSHTPFLRHRADTEEALRGTGFDRVMQAADYERSCDSISMIDWLKEAARYPALEYLFKLGMETLGIGVLNGRHKRLLNLRGKTAAQVLRISSVDWGWLKGNGKRADETFLSICHLIRKRGLRMGTEFIWRLSRTNRAENIEDMAHAMEDPGQLGKALRYILKKQINARDYADHLRMLHRQAIPLSDGAMLFPADFEETHGRLAMREKVRVDKEKQATLEKNLKKLHGFRFSALGLVLSPIPSLADVVREGNALSHCVGTYCDRYAAGETILCTLREEEKMDAPLYTVEFTPNGRMIQCRGYKNRTRPRDEDRLTLFFRLFASMRRDANERSGRTA